MSDLLSKILELALDDSQPGAKAELKRSAKLIGQLARLKWVTEHSNAVIDIKVDNGMIDSKVKGNLAGIVLACADIVRSSCEHANMDPKDVLETIGALIDTADVQKR